MHELEKLVVEGAIPNAYWTQCRGEDCEFWREAVVGGYHEPIYGDVCGHPKGNRDCSDCPREEMNGEELIDDIMNSACGFYYALDSMMELFRRLERRNALDDYEQNAVDNIRSDIRELLGGE